ncbi:MAG: MTH938/NDUFAF3 family protein [Pseudomonadota bacterium]
MTDAAARFLPRQVPIDAYGNGGFRFDGMSHRGSLLAMPGGMAAWSVIAPSGLTRDGLGPVLEWLDAPELMLFGTGRELVPLDPALRFLLKERGMASDVMATGSAARTYNILLGEGRSIGAALIAVA